MALLLFSACGEFGAVDELPRPFPVWLSGMTGWVECPDPADASSRCAPRKTFLDALVEWNRRADSSGERSGLFALAIANDAEAVRDAVDLLERRSASSPGSETSSDLAAGLEILAATAKSEEHRLRAIEAGLDALEFDPAEAAAACNLWQSLRQSGFGVVGDAHYERCVGDAGSPEHRKELDALRERNPSDSDAEDIDIAFERVLSLLEVGLREDSREVLTEALTAATTAEQNAALRPIAALVRSAFDAGGRPGWGESFIALRAARLHLNKREVLAAKELAEQLASGRHGVLDVLGALVRSEVAYHLGHNDDALVEAQEATQAAVDLGDLLEAKARHQLGLVLATRGDVAAAIPELALARDRALAVGSRRTRISALTNLALLQLELGLYPEAWSNVVSLARSHLDREDLSAFERYRIFELASAVAQRASHHRTALLFAAPMLPAAREIGVKAAEVSALRLQAKSLAGLEQPDAALRHLAEAERLAYAEPDAAIQAMLLADVGLTGAEMLEGEEALREGLFDRAARLQEATGNTLVVPRAMELAARRARERGDVELQRSLLDQALHYSSRIRKPGESAPDPGVVLHDIYSQLIERAWQDRSDERFFEFLARRTVLQRQSVLGLDSLGVDVPSLEDVVAGLEPAAVVVLLSRVDRSLAAVVVSRGGLRADLLALEGDAAASCTEGHVATWLDEAWTMEELGSASSSDIYFVLDDALLVASTVNRVTDLALARGFRTVSIAATPLLGYLQEAKPQKAKLQKAVVVDGTAGSGPFPALEWGRREVELAAAALETHAEQVVVSRRREQALALLEGADWIHITAHGVAEPSGAPGFWVAGADDAPGPITSVQIADLQLDASTVFLASCAAAANRSDERYGTRSLVLAFLAAGAREVVAAVSLIDDRESYRLAQSFYAALEEEDVASRALAATLRRHGASAGWGRIVFGLPAEGAPSAR